MENKTAKQSNERKKLPCFYLVSPFTLSIPSQLALQLKYFWVPGAHTFLPLTVVQSLTINRPPPFGLPGPTHGTEELSKLSGQCSAVDRLPTRPVNKLMGPDFAENSQSDVTQMADPPFCHFLVWGWEEKGIPAFGVKVTGSERQHVCCCFC